MKDTDKIIHFTTADFTCKCGFKMSWAVTEPEEDPEHQGFHVGDEVECFNCEAKYKITEQS